MLLDPSQLQSSPALLEEVERIAMRLVTQALVDYREEATKIFAAEVDLVADIGEDITREAIDRLRLPTIPVRLMGKVDYKRAVYTAHPEFIVRQALFVDSKAEKAATSITIQMAQTSLEVRQIRAGATVVVGGGLPAIYPSAPGPLLTTTIFVKYEYREDTAGDKRLVDIVVLGLPNGFLQDVYCPSTADNIWGAGRNAPSLGEAFRVRVNLARLIAKARWRVQHVPVDPRVRFKWEV